MTLLADEGVTGLTARNVAYAADTSTPAVYELFGDKAGLVRELFFEGFRLLGARLEAIPDTDDPVADLVASVRAFRAFVQDHPVVAELMFSRPFADFDPAPAEAEAGATVRRWIVGVVSRCVDAGVIAGDPADVAHVLVVLTQGLAAAESSRRLGRSKASVNRRWDLAVQTLLRGLAPQMG